MDEIKESLTPFVEETSLKVLFSFIIDWDKCVTGDVHEYVVPKNAIEKHIKYMTYFFIAQR
ncbi:hypothetical protein TRIP_D420179 [uncultured Paludibacter sp.]|nr:hypothetical protein TRIP_D420179 [uncultured Paludibacter sp.]